MDIQRIDILNQISQLSSDCSVDHKAAIGVLKKGYNSILMETYNDTSDKSHDLIETLPLEVWVQVIQEALPTLDYARALLSLTTVQRNGNTASCKSLSYGRISSFAAQKRIH
jgi:hypothetical protein